MADTRAAARLGSSGRQPAGLEEPSMPWLPLYLDAFNAERNGAAAREAERRAMYARPDAPPLPALDPPKRWGRLAAILGRSARRTAASAPASAAGR